MVKKQLEFAFFVLMITVMIMSLNMAIVDSTGMNIKTLELFKYTFIIVVTVAVLVKYPITIFAALAVGVGVGAYAYLNQLVIPADVITFFRGFFTWLPQYVVGYEGFKLEYSFIFAILYIVLITVIMTLIVFSKKGYGILLALGTGAFAFFWFIYVSKARLYMFYFLFAGLILYSYNVYDRKKLEWVNDESKIDKYIEIKWVFNSLIIVIISLGISQFAVLDIKPVQWSWLNDRALQVFPFIENWRNDNFDGYSFGFNSRYGIESAGYKTTRLGGPVKLSEKVMLIAETDSIDNIYLRGTVKDFYTGNSWNKIPKSREQYNVDSLVPLPFYGVRTFRTELTISHQGMTTSSIFSPNTLTKVAYKQNRYFLDLDDEAVFPRNVPRKEKYTVTTEMPYIDADKIRSIKAGSILDSYIQLPNNISQRVRKLALDITSGYDNDYDKAKAIERYLRSHYRYTLTPSELPQGTEFVDYFLFEGKEGYCTYFATSMAVLLRSADIPCRYVEGFLAKYQSSSVRNISGLDAHAWVEVDFGPYGWLTFEATPAYPIVGNRTQSEVPTAPIPEPEQNQPPNVTAPVDTTDRDKDLEQDEEEGTGNAEQQSKELSLTMRILSVLFLIVLLRVLYLLAKKAYFELRLKKSAGKSYAVRYLLDIMRYMRKLNVKMHKEQTMREYWFSVKHALESQYQDGDQIIALLEKLRYGNAQVEAAELNQLEEYRKKLKKYVTARLGTVKAFIAYYIVGL